MNLYRYVPTFYSWWWHFTRCRKCDGAGHLQCGMCNGTGDYPKAYMCGHCPLSQGRVQCPKCKGWEVPRYVYLYDAHGEYFMTRGVAPSIVSLTLPVYDSKKLQAQFDDGFVHTTEPPPISYRTFNRQRGTDKFYEEVR